MPEAAPLMVMILFEGEVEDMGRGGGLVVIFRVCLGVWVMGMFMALESRTR